MVEKPGPAGEDGAVFRDGLPPDAYRSLERGSPEGTGSAGRVFDRRVLSEPDEFFFFEEEEAPEARPEPESPPLFPPTLAREIRERAWAEYARKVSIRKEENGRPAVRRDSTLRPWIEASVCLGVLAALNAFVFPEDPGFRSLEFNPFFVPVALFAFRYGTRVGLASGLAAAAWLAIAAGGFDLENGSLVLPGLLVALGAAVGSLSNHQGDRLAFYRALARDLEAEGVHAREALTARNAVIRDLQGRIEQHALSLESLYEISRGMASGRPDVMYPCLLDILARDLGAERSSVYRLTEGRLVLQSSRDLRVGAAPFAPVLPADQGLAGLALRLNRRVSVFDREAASLRGKSGILCGIVAESGSTAVVQVEDMSLLDFSASAVSRFGGLLRWAGESAALAARRREAADQGLVDRETGTYREGMLAEILDKEIGRAERFDTPLRLLMVRVIGFDGIPEARRSPVRELVARALCGYTRQMDTVCSMQRPDTFAVVLPMYRGEDPEPLAERVRQELERAGWGPALQLSFSFSDLGGEPARPADLLLRAEAELA